MTDTTILLPPFVGLTDVHYDDFDENDDLLKQGEPLSIQTLTHRISAHSWLKGYLEQNWPGHSSSPYLNAYALLARIVVTAAVIETTHSADLARILGVSEMFVLAAIGYLEVADWQNAIVPLLVEDGDDTARIRADLDTFLFSAVGVKIDLLTTLKILGTAL